MLFIKKYIISFIFFGGVTFLLKRNILFFTECSIVNLLFFSIVYKKLLLKNIKKKAKYKTYNFSVDLNDNGIEYAAYNYRINLKWTSISGIVESARYIHVFNDSNEAIFIPKKAFSNAEDIRNLIQKVNDQMELKGSE